MFSNRVKEENENATDGLIKLMNIIIMMRKDLGYSSSQLGPEDLLRTFITDLDKHLPQIK